MVLGFGCSGLAVGCGVGWWRLWRVVLVAGGWWLVVRWLCGWVVGGGLRGGCWRENSLRFFR